jgi:hypothetical protein
MPDTIFKKINYFKGFFLEARDLQAAEAYRDRTRWLHNLHFHGPGVVRGYGDGLELTVNDAGDQVTVRTGLAIDSEGHELARDDPFTYLVDFDRLDRPCTLYFGLRYQTRLVDERRNESKPEYTGYAFWEEYAEVVVTTEALGDPILELGRVALAPDLDRIRMPARPDAPRTNELDVRARRYSGIVRERLRLADVATCVLDAQEVVQPGRTDSFHISEVVDDDRPRFFLINVRPRTQVAVSWHQVTSVDSRNATEYKVMVRNHDESQPAHIHITVFEVS